MLELYVAYHTTTFYVLHSYKCVVKYICLSDFFAPRNKPALRPENRKNSRYVNTDTTGQNYVYQNKSERI